MFHHLRQGVRDLFPGYFALVMATGIVSLACDFLDLPLVGWVLFLVNNGLYVLLAALTVARLVCFPAQVLRDLADHQTAPTFLTVVAGTCILGTQHRLLWPSSPLPWALWIAGVVLWLVLIYAFFTSVSVREDKPPLEKGIGGSWLLTVVSTQSLAVLGALLATDFDAAEALLFASLGLFLLGCMFYLPIITLIFYRFSFFKLSPAELTPPYWINMGAVAITTMAGARLLAQTGTSPLLRELRPFLMGFTMFFWATATWWIPFLLILGDWRHVIRRTPLTYHPAYWSMVFPLGMYTAATYQMARVLELPFLLPIPRFLVFFALAAWLLLFVAMLGSLLRSLRSGLS